MTSTLLVSFPDRRLNFRIMTPYIKIGWKVVLTPRVPELTREAIAPAFKDLTSTLPRLPAEYRDPADFDWAMHPGGATILSGAERALQISPEHMRASYDTYISHGNSSSATIYSVMDRLRTKDMDALAPGDRVRDYVIGCAFGPGISVEMCMLKRSNAWAHARPGDLPTPPEIESELIVADQGHIDAKVGGYLSSELGDAAALVGAETFIEEQLRELELD